MSKPSLKQTDSDTDAKKVIFKNFENRGVVNNEFWRPNGMVTSLRC